MPAIHPISALPPFASPDQHASLVASTPTSFNDIPPIVQHQEQNVTLALDPPLSEFSGDDLKGSLYVLTSALVFWSSAKERGFQVEYPSITLHAVSRGEPGPSIYCQLDESNAEQTAAEDQQYDDMRELTIIPSSPESLEPIFEALSHCASLHPGDDVEDDNEFDEAFIDSNTNFEVFNGTGDEELSEVGRAALQHLESIIYNPFEDAQQGPSTGTPSQDNLNGKSESEQKGTSNPS